MGRSHSKHGYAARPLLTTLWIMWLLPTSNSIPHLFVLPGFSPKWQIGGSNLVLKLLRWPRWSSLRRLFVSERGSETAKHCGPDRGVWRGGLLCVPLFVWVCQSACDSRSLPLNSSIVLRGEPKVHEGGGGLGSATSHTCFQMDANSVACRDRMWCSKHSSAHPNVGWPVEDNMISRHVAAILISFISYYVVIPQSSTTEIWTTDQRKEITHFLSQIKVHACTRRKKKTLLLFTYDAQIRWEDRIC